MAKRDKNSKKPGKKGSTSVAVAQPSNRHEGASKGRRGQRWQTDNLTPQQETKLSLYDLRKRSRDQFQNNAYAKRAIKLISSEGVGTGISVKLTETRGTAKIARLIRLWMDSPMATIGGRTNYYKLQGLCVDTKVKDGEYLVRRHWKREPRSGLLLRLEVLSADWLDTSRDGPVTSSDKDGRRLVIGQVVNGIEYDSIGDRAAYYIKRSLGEDIWESVSRDPIRVPARDMIHGYRQEVPEQERGMPWLAPVLWTGKDLVDYADAEIVRKKLSAALMLVRKRPDNGQPGELGKDGEPRPRTDVIQPGSTLWIGDDESAEYLDPPQSTGFEEGVRVGLRQIAVAMPVSYEALSGDFSKTNYSSGRLGWHLMGRSLDQLIWLEVVPHLCEGIMAWLREATMVDPDALGATHFPPKREMLDPSKEIPPEIMKIRAGLGSRTAAIQKMGEDPEVVDAEQAADNKRADALGLAYDSDGRRPANGGRPPQDEALDDDGEGTGDGDKPDPDRDDAPKRKKKKVTEK